MSAIVNTARMGTRTCSKGMFNDLIGQWNVHVHSWCHTKNIRKWVVGIPSSPSCLLEESKNEKEGERDVWVLCKRFTSRGRATPYQNGKTLTVKLCLWVIALPAFRTLGTCVSIWERRSIAQKQRHNIEAKITHRWVLTIWKTQNNVQIRTKNLL